MEETISKNFIEQIIEKDIEKWALQEGSYKISTRTKRISSYRTRKIHLIKLWTGSGIWQEISISVLMIQTQSK